MLTIVDSLAIRPVIQVLDIITDGLEQLTEIFEADYAHMAVQHFWLEESL
jgi:hypothetical protein